MIGFWPACSSHWLCSSHGPEAAGDTTLIDTEINYQTAETWLKNHYKGVPGIWKQFDLELAAISLTENALALDYGSFDDFSGAALMCIMADAKM